MAPDMPMIGAGGTKEFVFFFIGVEVLDLE
jgi:hypothetical protein